MSELSCDPTLCKIAARIGVLIGPENHDTGRDVRVRVRILLPLR